ncbi:ATP-grasp domain-containing protein [bacterium]|nr:ATP-grasp domain-containing protein [bacterium]
MKLVVTYSSKDGLRREYERRACRYGSVVELPADYFAEGDSPETIQTVLGAFSSKGHEVIGLEADERVGQNLLEAAPDMVFNIAEGLYGDSRESYVPTICEHLGLAYSGSDPLTLALCLNKARAKEILSFHGIATPRFYVITSVEDDRLCDFPYPGIIKPISEGSSKGIFEDSVVKQEAAARVSIGKMLTTYDQAVIIEEFLPGQEFTVAVWGNGPEAEVLPIIGMNFDDLPPGANGIYSYEAKWLWDVPEKPLQIFSCPADISEALRQKIEMLVLRTCAVLQVRDWGRIDVRLDHASQPHILEVNPLPGILPKPEDNSCFPKAARTAGYSYADMLEHVVQIAMKRTGLLECGGRA